MEDFKNLLTINPKTEENPKNLLKVWIKMDSNDADYIEKTERMNPNDLFNNKKLIYCLAYVTAHRCADVQSTWRYDKPIFGEHANENRAVEKLCDILGDYDFMVYSDWGECHTYEDLEITYFDENGKEFNVTFDDIHKQFETMTHKQICDLINSIEYKF